MCALAHLTLTCCVHGVVQVHIPGLGSFGEFVDKMGCSSSVAAGYFDHRVFFDTYIRDGTKILRNLPHSNALHTPYPCFGGLERYMLKPNSAQLSWQNDLPAYAATEFTAGFVLKMPVWADLPDVRHVAFNAFDPSCRVDRTSAEGE